ncbi:MAG: hypothetical protein LBQ50_14845, partial [Planctomycetaceae bacterium]|nr:hypothetical protein [Planctomycetaceae bacterium]
MTRKMIQKMLSGLTLVILSLMVSAGYSQTIYNSFMDVVSAQYCVKHFSVGYQFGMGTVTLGGGLNANGVQWQAVRPSGAVITSGTISGVHDLSYGLGSGTLFRLQTNGNYLGFRHKGPWATSPIWFKGANIVNPGATCPY